MACGYARSRRAKLVRGPRASPTAETPSQVSQGRGTRGLARRDLLESSVECDSVTPKNWAPGCLLMAGPFPLGLRDPPVSLFRNARRAGLTGGLPRAIASGASGMWRPFPRAIRVSSPPRSRSCHSGQASVLAHRWASGCTRRRAFRAVACPYILELERRPRGSIAACSAAKAERRVVESAAQVEGRISADSSTTGPSLRNPRIVEITWLPGPDSNQRPTG
jgi:hypothetical protein